MELYQRLLQLVELLANNSQAKFAKGVGLSQQTFNNYLNPDGQQKIRKSLLDKVLTIYPEVNRDWLFFDEGEPLGGKKTASDALLCQNDKDRRIAELEAELAEERRLNRQLITRLLANGVGDKGANNAGKTGKELDNPC